MASAARDPAVRLRTRGGTLECRVTGEGEPGIVLFNGSGMTLDTWDAMQPGLEGLGTVFAWNRFGVDSSESDRDLHTGALVAASLRELLNYAAMPVPCVLVAHSVGALHAQLFARLHPTAVAGLLLVEPTPADDASAATRIDEFSRALSKVQGVPAARFEDNLRAELRGLPVLQAELRAAPAMPGVPVVEVSGTGSHFPHMKEPQAVLDALRRLLAGIRAGQWNALADTLGG